MEEAIIGVFNRMGFGVNGVMTNDPKMFCGRIEMTFPHLKFELKSNEDNECVYHVNCGKGFNLQYKWTDDKRVIDVKVL